MTLGFSTKIGKWETKFPEKILECLINGKFIKPFIWAPYLLEGTPYCNYELNKLQPKKHSIRKGNRWREGMKIHFVTGNRTKNRYQFAPVMEAVSVQHIKILNVFLDKTVMVDGAAISKGLIKQLALNDGFDTVDQFWEYFGQADFEGQIIHWTDEKY